MRGGSPRMNLVPHFLRTFVSQETRATEKHHIQGRRDQAMEQESERDNDGFVQHGPFPNGPEHWQLPRGLEAHSLLGIDRQIVTQNACRLRHGRLAGHSHIVHEHGDVVQKCKETRSHGSKMAHSWNHPLCKPHSLDDCSHHHLPARGCSPSITALVQGAHPIEG